jgi:hypothetical protein
MKDKLIIVTLASVSLLALTLAARAGIEEGRKVIPHSWLHKTHHIPCVYPNGYSSGYCSTARPGSDGGSGIRLHNGGGGTGVRLGHTCTDPMLPSWAKC